MITIINRDYIYEKVNSTFCTAHQVVIDTILGKSLEEFWGTDTFKNDIKMLMHVFPEKLFSMKPPSLLHWQEKGILK